VEIAVTVGAIDLSRHCECHVLECCRHWDRGLHLIGVSLMDGTIRAKTALWFATAVVFSVFATLLVSHEWRADAAPGDTDSTFVPVTPCRLFDFRSGPNNVGPKNTPLGAGESSVYIQNVTGTNGDCNIPPGAVGVAMNVTIVSPTAQSNLRVFPADVETPNASNLNWLAGQSPTPNKVDVKLSPDGKIKLYNHAGTVDVLADVVGYYTDNTLVELANSRPIARSASSGSVGTLPTPGGTIVLSVTIEAPVAGLIQIAASAQIDDVVGDMTGGNYGCHLTEGTGIVNGAGTLGLTDRVTVVASTEAASCSTNGALAVTRGTYMINLVLSTTASVADGYEEVTLDALFVAGGSTT
jgi:hypothetical protein